MCTNSALCTHFFDASCHICVPAQHLALGDADEYCCPSCVVVLVSANISLSTLVIKCTESQEGVSGWGTEHHRLCA